MPEGQNWALLLFHSLYLSLLLLPLSLYSHFTLSFLLFPSLPSSFSLSPFTLSLSLFECLSLSLTLFLLLSDFNEKFLYEGGRKEDLTFIAIESNKRDLKKKKKEKKNHLPNCLATFFMPFVVVAKYLRILLLRFIPSFVVEFSFTFFRKKMRSMVEKKWRNDSNF